MLASLTLLRDRIDNPTTYPFTVAAIQSLTTLTFSRSRLTFFTGENGSGKSTLLEAIALSYGLSLDGGNRNFAFDAGLPTAGTVIKMFDPMSKKSSTSTLRCIPVPNSNGDPRVASLYLKISSPPTSPAAQTSRPPPDSPSPSPPYPTRPPESPDVPARSHRASSASARSFESAHSAAHP
jgi:hypothetical protein